MKKTVFLILFFSFLLSADGTLFQPEVAIPKELRTSIIDIKKISKHIEQIEKTKKSAVNKKTKTGVNGAAEKKTDNRTVFSIKKTKPEKLVIEHIPYEFLKYKAIKVFGNIVKYRDSKGRIRITSKDKLVKYYNTLNGYINEFINKVVEYKKAHKKELSNPYIEVEIRGCGDLYPYYGEKITDCYQLFKMLDFKDKKELLDFANSFLRK